MLIKWNQQQSIWIFNNDQNKCESQNIMMQHMWIAHLMKEQKEKERWKKIIKKHRREQNNKILLSKSSEYGAAEQLLMNALDKTRKSEDPEEERDEDEEEEWESEEPEREEVIKEKDYESESFWIKVDFYYMTNSVYEDLINQLHVVGEVVAEAIAIIP